MGKLWARVARSFMAPALAIGLLIAAAVPSAAQFETRSSVTTPGYLPLSAVVGDFNRDGNLDIALVDYLPAGRVYIFLGNGDGTFRSGSIYTVAIQPIYAATASFRNNGILDLVVGDSLSQDVYVMLGNGDGTFRAPTPYHSGGEPYQVSTGDFNGDGKIDIISFARTGVCSCVEVLPGNGDGTFGAPIETRVPYGGGGPGVAVADFNGDGKLDVALPGEFNHFFGTAIMLGNGDGTFRTDGYYSYSEPQFAAAADLRGDGKIDIVTSDQPAGNIGILFGYGDGMFQRPVTYETWFPTWVAVGDFNGDGFLDLVAANAGSPQSFTSSTVSVFTNNRDGTFQPGVSYPAGKSLNYVAVGDFNGDGQPDLVAIDKLGGAAIALLNTSVVAFAPTTPLDFGFQLVGSDGRTQTVTLTNAGQDALKIYSTNLEGQFKMGSTCGSSLAAGASCAISVYFTPTTQGNHTGIISIDDSASSKPQVVELTGAGTFIQLLPATLTFPAQRVGTTSSPQTFEVVNKGSKPIDIFSVAIHGFDERDFSQTNDCPASLGPKASCTVSVTFAPALTGLRTALIYVYDNGGGSPQSLPMTGTGD